MKNAIVKTNSYDIIIGHDNFDVLSAFVEKGQFSSVFVLTDKTVAKLYANAIASVLPHARFITIPAGEKHKTLKTLETIWQRLFAMGADRHSLLINLGGGVIGDIGGLAAALYMRGMRFVQVPTTLLAQVDASVGGKTAVNLSCCKNIIGSFAQPSLVLINAATLATLPRRELLSGMAEVIKHGLIKDKRYLKVAATSPSPSMNIIADSCRIKAHFVNQDEHEKGPRKILNFGHTIGHAIETLSHRTRHPLLHGEAIALGMIAEAKLSVLNGNLPEKDFIRIKENVAQSCFCTQKPPVFNVLSDTGGLRIRKHDRATLKKDILRLIHKDKKNKGKAIKWTLLTAIGSAIYDIECTPAAISTAIEEIL